MLSNIYNAIAASNQAIRTYVFNGLLNYDTPAENIRSAAGVFKEEDDALIRTLWGNKTETPNSSPTFQWDGLDNEGNKVPNGNYYFKIKTNNVVYNYDGTVGNSSDDLYGDYYHRGAGIVDICFVETEAFYGLGYSEHGSALKAFSTVNPQKLISEPYNATTQVVTANCADNDIIYWAGWTNKDNEQQNNFVIGTLPADNSNGDPLKTVTFSSGQAHSSFNGGQGAVSYPSIIAPVFNDNNGSIRSMDVQKNGNLLFIVRPNLNQLQIVDKRTSSGVVLQTLTYTNPAAVACDDNGNLCMVYNGSLHKFSVSASGVLTDLNLSFTGLINPGFVDISPDNTIIAVSDNSTNQVKFYNVNGGNIISTIGTGVSYSTNPWAADDKFFNITFLKYQPDGCLWIGDASNKRYQRFNSNLSYKDNIAFIPFSRIATISETDPTRVFSNFVEYERDYSKPLAGTNGSWKFKANWQGSYEAGEYLGFRHVSTYSNGRTYGKITNGEIEVELTNTGLRETGFSPIGIDDNGQPGRDGTYFYPLNHGNDYMTVSKRVITSFTSEGNPIRSEKIPFVQTGSGTSNGYNPSTGYEKNVGHTNNSDRYVFFSNLLPDNDAIMSYHLGAIKPGANKFLWKTSQSTFRNYNGNYPTNGDYDIGNGNQHSENCKALIYDQDIFWNVNGEGYKEGEINIWNHFTDDGLHVGHFGTQNNGVDQPFAAGNAFGTGLSKNGDNYELVWCDESVKAGVGCCTVSGLNTIANQVIFFKISRPIIVPVDPSNLMQNLPFHTNFTGGFGWTVDQPTSGLIMPTNSYLYRRDDVDIRITGTSNQIVRRTLNNDIALNNWNLSGGIAMYNKYPSDQNGTYNNLEIIDTAGKIIIKFDVLVDSSQGYACYIRANNNIITQGTVFNLFYPTFWGGFTDFNFKCVNGNLSFKFGGYDEINIDNVLESGANKLKPAFLRINQNGSDKAMDLCKLKFIKD